MKGFKVFNPDFSCKGMIFEENKTFEVSLPISICSHGLHFCTKASHCFSYYGFDPNNIVCEVEAIGEVQTHNEDSKVCTNILKIGKRLTWAEVLVFANEGKNNTGHSNSGDRNSGDSNSGDRNSGNWNSGDRNSGDSNSGYRNSGAFCLDENPKLVLFDNLTDINVRDWENSEAVRTMNELLETTIWVESSNMTAEEKEKWPKHETTGGYLKAKSMHEAWSDMWGNLNAKKRKLFLDLPNFDAGKFAKITGIKVL